jgi:hypothetical protein|tara:strand:- start:1508 stop:2146 length:639 start_codon:yes stop_codon:yes gene_type:complete
MVSLDKKRHALAFGLSLILVASLLSLLMLKSSSLNLVTSEITIREVAIESAPLPPPPALQNQQEIQVDLLLDVSGEGAAMAVSQPVFQETIENIELENIDMQNFSAALDLKLNVDWSAFTLDQLDANPVLLTELQARFPRKMINRGINAAVVKLDIFIDERGQPSLVSVTQNDFPELEEQIRSIVNRARFTIPKHDGIAVRARFIWPVEFKH